MTTNDSRLKNLSRYKIKWKYTSGFLMVLNTIPLKKKLKKYFECTSSIYYIHANADK